VELVDLAGTAGGFDETPDLVFTTGLLDAAQLRAMLPAPVRARPLVVYMHENQAAYPASDQVSEQNRSRDAHLVVTNLASLLASDRILWNSAFNRDSFLEGAVELLRHAPGRNSGGWCETIRERSHIAWPPVEPIPEAVLRNPADGGYADGTLVAWPHRWEHDKGPEELLSLADQLAEPLDLRFVLLGERSSRVPDALDRLRARHGGRIIHDGWVEDRSEYLGWLAASDWVLSTARHEFFGIAVVEALLCGCLPWLPRRLSYPELLPEGAHGLSPENPPADRAGLLGRIRSHLAGALAPTAVGRIDDLVEDVLSAHR